MLVFSSNQLLILLIFSPVFLVSISYICALIFAFPPSAKFGFSVLFFSRSLGYVGLFEAFHFC